LKALTASTRVFALLGDPVHHSLSPVFQNAAMRALELDGVYVALRTSAEMIEPLLRALALAGGGGNVTVPHKRRAAAAVERRTAAVDRTEACNTFWLEDGVVWGDNTDVLGFVAAVRALIGSPAGARVLLLGAGGAARAALCGLIDEHADLVVLHNRTAGKAEELSAAFPAAARRVRVVSDAAALRREGFDLVVNATSLGLHAEDDLPISLERIHRAGAVLDLVYGPKGTRWVQEARRLGVPAADGLEMLLHQGAAAFQRWWGVTPPLETLRKAVSD
jgi:shikimate dehydrogenase